MTKLILIFALLIPQQLIVKNISSCEILVTVYQLHRPIGQVVVRQGGRWPMQLDVDPLAPVSYRVDAERCKWVSYTAFARWPLPDSLIIKDP